MGILHFTTASQCDSQRTNNASVWLHTLSAHCACGIVAVPVRAQYELNAWMMMINCACENYGFVCCKLVYNRINSMLYISFGAFADASSESCVCCNDSVTLLQAAWLSFMHIREMPVAVTKWKRARMDRTRRANDIDDDDDREMVCEWKWTRKTGEKLVVDNDTCHRWLYSKRLHTNERKPEKNWFNHMNFKCHLPSSPQIGANKTGL